MGGVWASPEELNKIWNMHRKGFTFKAIADKVGRSSSFVANVIKDGRAEAVAKDLEAQLPLTPTATTTTETAPSTATTARARVIDTILGTSLSRDEKLRVIEAML